MTGGLEGFLLEVGLFSEAGKKKKREKQGIRKTRPDRSSGLSVPQKAAHGAAPDVGSGI